MLEELHDRALLAFLLSRLEHYIPLLVPFPGLARGFLKALLGLWGGAGAEAKSSGGGTEAESEEAERVRAQGKGGCVPGDRTKKPSNAPTMRIC